VTGNGVAKGHGRFFQGLNGGVQRRQVVTVGTANVVRAEDGDEEVEFAIIDEFVEFAEEGSGIDGDTGRQHSD
jgi:hypothetical protein